MRFVDADRLASLTGEPVRSEWRMPGEAQGLPSADAVVVAPATFDTINTINEWAAGITGTRSRWACCVNWWALVCRSAEEIDHAEHLTRR